MKTRSQPKPRKAPPSKLAQPNASRLTVALSKGTGPMGWDLWECGLSVRVRNWAHRNGLRSVADLVACDPRALILERGMGKGGVDEMRAWLEPVLGVSWEEAYAAHPRPRPAAPPALPPSKPKRSALGDLGDRWDDLQHKLSAPQADVFVYDLGLSARMFGYCERHGVERLGELVRIPAVELAAAPNLSSVTLRTSVEVIEAFSQKRARRPAAPAAAESQATGDGPRFSASRWDALRRTLSAEVLDESVFEVSLPTRMLRYCEREGVERLGDLLCISAADLIAARSLGGKSLRLAASAIRTFQLRRAEERVLWQDGLIESLERQLQGFSAEQRLVLERRAGLSGPPQTHRSIAAERGGFPQVVSQQEQLVIGRLLRREGWIAYLRRQFDWALADGMVDLRSLALNSWWTKAAGRPQALAYICRRLFDERWHVVALDGEYYLGELTQEQLAGVTGAARRRARELKLPQPLSALRALFEEVLREQLGSQITLLCAAAKEALWRDLADLLSVEGDPPRVVAFGHGKRAQLLAFLTAQPEPLPVGGVRAHVGIRYMTDDVFYFGHGLVGVEKHFPDFSAWRERLVPRVVSIMRRDAKRQWHCKTLLQALREALDLPSWFDHWHLANVVRRTQQLEYLGRLRVALPGAVKNSRRIYVREVLAQILEEQGRPMSTAELLAKGRERMVVLTSLPPKLPPPIVKLAPGVWGLAERDLPSGERRSASRARRRR